MVSRQPESVAGYNPGISLLFSFTAIADARRQTMRATISFFLLKTIRCVLARFQLHHGKPPSLEMSSSSHDLNSGFDLRIKFLGKKKWTVCLWSLNFSFVYGAKTEIITFDDVPLE